MSFEQLLTQSTEDRVTELEKKRGRGNVFEPSPLSDEERKEHRKKRNRLNIKKRNTKEGRKK